MRAVPSIRLVTLILVLGLGACASLPGGRDANRGECRSPVEAMREQLAETRKSLDLIPKQVVFWDAYQEGVSALLADQFRLDRVHDTDQIQGPDVEILRRALGTAVA